MSDEDHSRLRMLSAKNRVSMYKMLTIIMRYYDPDNEVPTIQEGDPTPVKAKRTSKYTATARSDMDTVISEYTSLYLKHIGSVIPYTNKAIVYRNMSDPLKHYGLPRLLELLEAYLASNDKYFRAEKWGILTFLAMRTLNKLEQ